MIASRTGLALALILLSPPVDALRRRLQDEDEQQYQNYNYNDASASTVEATPTIGYLSCSSEDNSVYFSVCPHKSGSCSAHCQGGTTYQTDMMFFLQTFMSARSREQAYLCSVAEQYCNNNNYDCFASYGAYNCNNEKEEGQQEEGDEQQGQQAYYGCASYDETFFVGPHCHRGRIYQGLFMDYQCTNLTSASTFSDLYGYELDNSYRSGTSLLEDRKCTVCSVPDNYQNNQNGNNNQNYNNYESSYPNDCAALAYAGDRIAVSNPPAGFFASFFSGTAGFLTLIIVCVLLGGMVAAWAGAYAAKVSSKKSAPLMEDPDAEIS